jgi:hypothetical protein
MKMRAAVSEKSLSSSPNRQDRIAKTLLGVEQDGLAGDFVRSES